MLVKNEYKTPLPAKMNRFVPIHRTPSDADQLLTSFETPGQQLRPLQTLKKKPLADQLTIKSTKTL